jgi:hypothetical protein
MLKSGAEKELRGGRHLKNANLSVSLKKKQDI